MILFVKHIHRKNVVKLKFLQQANLFSKVIESIITGDSLSELFNSKTN